MTATAILRFLLSDEIFAWSMKRLPLITQEQHNTNLVVAAPIRID